MHGGILVSTVLRTVLIVYPRGITVASLETGAIQRSLQFTDVDRDCLSPTDYITTVASDPLGKKFFIGSNLGFVFVMDVGSAGVLKCIHSSDAPTESSVISLNYFGTEEVLIAVFGSGTIKVLSGVYRLYVDPQDPLRFPSLTPPLPLWNGGRQIPLLRTGNFTNNSTVILACASEELGLVATSGSDGVVRVFDASEMRLKALYLTPVEQDNIIVHCHAMCFVEGRAALVGVDGNARVTIWAVHPERPRCILCCRISPVDLEASLNAVNAITCLVSGQNKSFLYVGDEMGKMWTIDITGLWGSSKSKLLKRQSSVAMLSKRSLNDEEMKSIEKMMKEPVGMHSPIAGGRMRAADISSRASFQKIFDVSLGGRFSILSQSQPFASALRCITILRDVRINSEVPTATHIIASSDRGVARLFTLNGEVLGDIHTATMKSENDNTSSFVDNSSWGFQTRADEKCDRTSQMASFLEGLDRPLLYDDWGVSLSPNQASNRQLPTTPLSPGTLTAEFNATSGVPCDGYEAWKYILTEESSHDPNLSRDASEKNTLWMMQHKRKEAEARSRKRIYIGKLWEAKIRFPHYHEECIRKTHGLSRESSPFPAESHDCRILKLEELNTVGIGFEDNHLSSVSNTLEFCIKGDATENSSVDAIPVTVSSPTSLPTNANKIDGIIAKLHSLTIPLKDNIHDRIEYASSPDNIRDLAPLQYQESGYIGQYFIDTFTQIVEKQDCTQPKKVKERPRSATALRIKTLPQIGAVVDIEERDQLRLKTLLSGKKKHMKSAARGRFGPYEFLEVLRFVLFTIELRPSDRGWNFNDGTHFNGVAIAKSRDFVLYSRFVKAVEAYSKSSLSSLISRWDLMQLIFEHATKAEKIRISTLATLSHTLWRLLDTLSPPSLTSKPIPSFTKKQILSQHVEVDLSIFPRRTDFSSIDMIKGFEGWQVRIDLLFEASSIFEGFTKTSCGTCICRELPLIMQNYAPSLVVRQFLRFSDTLDRVGLPPETEVDGCVFLKVVTDCLKLCLNEESEVPSRGHRAT